MSNQDHWISAAVIGFIVIYGMVFITGYLNGRLVLYTAITNIVASLTILIYWVQKAIRVQRLIIETREIIVIAAELLVIAVGIFVVLNAFNVKWLRFFNWLVFGVDLLVLLLFLLFMLTFKIKRLM